MAQNFFAGLQGFTYVTSCTVSRYLVWNFTLTENTLKEAEKVLGLDGSCTYKLCTFEVGYLSSIIPEFPKALTASFGFSAV